ncbi:MAG: MTH865 family protein [Methanoculleus sp.]|nr:MTH865 family protein [Methanoculleus sp.]
MNVKEEIRSQITGALAGAKFPIKTPEELLAAFPMGAATTCKAGDVEMTAGEAGTLLTPEDFPLTSPGQVADTILSRAGM